MATTTGYRYVDTEALTEAWKPDIVPPNQITSGNCKDGGWCCDDGSVCSQWSVGRDDNSSHCVTYVNNSLCNLDGVGIPANSKIWEHLNAGWRNNCPNQGGAPPDEAAYSQDGYLTCEFPTSSLNTVTAAKAYKTMFVDPPNDKLQTEQITKNQETYNTLMQAVCTVVDSTGCAPDTSGGCSGMRRYGEVGTACSDWYNALDQATQDSVVNDLCKNNQYLDECQCVNLDSNSYYNNNKGLSPFDKLPVKCWVPQCVKGSPDWKPATVRNDESNCPDICEAISNVITDKNASSYAKIDQKLNCPGAQTGCGAHGSPNKDNEDDCICHGDGWVGKRCNLPCNGWGKLKNPVCGDADTSGHTPCECICYPGASGELCVNYPPPPPVPSPPSSNPTVIVGPGGTKNHQVIIVVAVVVIVILLLFVVLIAFRHSRHKKHGAKENTHSYYDDDDNDDGYDE